MRNNSTTPYHYSVGSGQNCLSIDGPGGTFVPAHALDMCDALELLTLPPGRTDRYGNWDLTICLDDDCLQSVDAPPGTYTVTINLSPAPAEGDATSPGDVTIKQPFTILPAEE